ncbi:tetratricopeptide repeat protein [Planctomycetota bacterium]
MRDSGTESSKLHKWLDVTTDYGGFVGSRFYGAEAVRRHIDTCRGCGRFGELLSHDSTLRAILLFFAVKTISKFRVMDRCPACGTYRRQRLLEWQHVKKDRIKSAFAALNKEPDNTEKLRDAVEALMYFQDEETFIQLATGLRDVRRNDPDVQTLLGKGYMRFSRYPEAEQAFRACLTSRDDHEIRSLLGLCLILQGRSEEAGPFLQQIFERRSTKDLHYLYRLVEGFQHEGRHDRVPATIGTIREVFAGNADERLLKAFERTSEKHRMSGQKVYPPWRPESPTPAKGGSLKLVFSLQRLLPVLGGLAVAAIYLIAAYNMADSPDVYIANGTPRKYTVLIGGKNKTVNSLSASRIIIPEGDYDVTVTIDGRTIPCEPVSIHTPFLTRPFLDRTFVVNPDKTAVLFWERIYYSARPGSAKAGEYDYHVGTSLHVFEGIDYHFGDFPQEITTESSGNVPRERIILSKDFEIGNMLNFLVKQFDVQHSVDYAKNILTFDPGTDSCLYALSGLLAGQDYIAFLKPGLDERPIRVNWHRMYQTTTEIVSRDYDLESEYQALLDKEGETPASLYLLARVVEDPKRNLALMEKAAEGTPPCSYALYGLGYSRLSQGRFDDALPLIDKAIGMEPGNSLFELMKSEALLALGKYVELLERYRRAGEERAGDPNAVAYDLRLLERLGRGNEIKKVLEAIS